MENSVGSTWFEDWFDTRYYHILYQNRNHSEARHFIENLLSYLDLEDGSNVLDLACGKGRHAKFLSEHGLNVTGIDLSVNSIAEARKMDSSSLHFEVADMRKFSLDQNFDVIFNLFTSFGYFEKKEENREVLRQVKSHLKGDGHLVLDFLNVDHVKSGLPSSEIKNLDGIDFHIDKKIEDGIIVKRIQFRDENGKEHTYYERVQALAFADFKEILGDTGMEIIDTFGDYNLNPFDSGTSERLILIAQ